MFVYFQLICYFLFLTENKIFIINLKYSESNYLIFKKKIIIHYGIIQYIVILFCIGTIVYYILQKNECVLLIQIGTTN